MSESKVNVGSAGGVEERSWAVEEISRAWKLRSHHERGFEPCGTQQCSLDFPFDLLDFSSLSTAGVVDD
jgi:hypothetical protein